jgi:CheY-like chemotaxis protein
VADDGVGMEATTLARAFEPFFSTKDVGKGSGLGLSQVYGFARAAGGFVELRSKPGAGTTVEIFLPSATAMANRRVDTTPRTAPEVGSSAMRRAAAGETVLAVEDDPEVLAAVIENLADLGYHVVAAHDAAEALDFLRGPERIDIMFSDVVMPGGMNGVKLAAEASRIRPGLKILLTSGYTGQALTGENGVPARLPLLPKPYRREDLASHLRLVLSAA